MTDATKGANAPSMPIDRRAALVSIARAGALILPTAGLAATAAMAAPTDPIFAAIERHRAAENTPAATVNAQDDVYARRHGREVTQADVDANEAASDVCDEAKEALLGTPVTTMAGLRALLEYVAKVDTGGLVPELGGELAPALLKSPLFAGEA